MKVNFEQQISWYELALCLTVLVVCSVPLLNQGPWWLPLYVLTIIAYRLLAYYKRAPQLPLWIRIFLVIFALFLLVNEYRTIWTNQFYVNFFVIFICMKVLETYQRRDIFFISLCCFYLIFLVLILSTQLWVFIYLAVALIACIALLMVMVNKKVTLTMAFKFSATNFVMVIPISLMLFFLFPRLMNPLWQVPLDNQTKVGFSEELSHGGLSELFYNNELAFRVRFTQQQIKTKTRQYWRGIVLSYFDGNKWRAKPFNLYSLAILPRLVEEKYDYEVLLEPQNTRWLFYLKNPANSSPITRFNTNQGLTTFKGRVQTSRLSYRLSLAKGKKSRPSRINLRLPSHSNPQLRNWARQLAHQMNNNKALIVKAVSSHIETGDFYYTLKPPLLNRSRHQLDTFWFSSKRGYCSHYASAVAFILRAAGVPARVIGGYYGGQYNPVGNYYSIYQYDAHAWVEYWLDDGYWHRLDPTRFIPEQNIEQAIQSRNQNYMLNNNRESGWFGVGLMSRMNIYLESLRYFSEYWLLFYNRDSQSALLSKLGVLNLTWSNLIALCIVLVILMMVILYCYYSYFLNKQSALNKEYQTLLKLIDKHYPCYQAGMTLHQLLAKLSKKYPHITPECELFLSKYEQMRLNSHQSSEKIVEIVTLFKQFRLNLDKLLKSSVS